MGRLAIDENSLDRLASARFAVGFVDLAAGLDLGTLWRGLVDRAAARNLHSQHSVVAVVQERSVIEGVLERCGRLSDLQASAIVCMDGAAAPLTQISLPVLALPPELDGPAIVRALDELEPRRAPEDAAKAQYFRAMGHEMQREYFGEEEAAFLLLPRLDYYAVHDRIDALQGQSPRSRAWPTEGGNEPEPEPGWDSDGTFKPAVVRQVFEEWKAAGKIFDSKESNPVS